MSLDDRASVSVDLEAIAANYEVLCGRAGRAAVAPVVKADAYGAGAGAVARRLWTAGARRFFVARVGEGEALRRSLGRRTAQILVLDGCPPGAAGRLQTAALTPVLNSLAQAAAYAGAGPAAVHVDTGLNRLGVRLEELEELRALRPTADLLISHLACAETPHNPMNARQRTLFEAAAQVFPEAPRSLCNTHGLELGPAYALDVVRPGVGLHGHGPPSLAARLRPARALFAPVLQVRTVEAGETIGYGAAYRAPGRRRVAILAAGYADGVLRAVCRGGYGWHDGRARPILGHVSMDLVALDVSSGVEPCPGERVELLGANVPLAAVAAAAGLSVHEVLAQACRPCARAPAA